jgi:hypothetical protein
MMHQTMLNPGEVTASYADGILTIKAEGEADSVRNVRVMETSANPGEPPRFRVQGEQHSGLGTVPYEARDEFKLDDAPQQIALQTSAGNRMVNVSSLTSR